MPTPTTILVTGGSPQTVNLNTYLSSPLYCVVKDENGNTMFNEPVVYSVPQTGPSGSFVTTGTSPFYTDTGVGGQASTGVNRMFSNATPGTWIAAVQSVNVLTLSAGFNITNVDTPAPATITASANTTQKAAQSSAYLPVSVVVKDQFGAPMAGVSVSFTVPSGRGTWPGGGSLTRTATTNGSGIATSPVLTASTTLGAFNLTVAAGSVTRSNLVSFTTIDAAVVTSISAYSGSNQNTPINQLFILPLVARAANALNAPVAGASILFTAPASGASCSFPVPFVATATAITDVNGLATTPYATANGVTGSYTVSAAKSGAATAFFGLTNGAAAATIDAGALSMCEA